MDAVCRPAEVRTVFSREFREEGEIFFFHLPEDFYFKRGVDQRHAAPLEAGAREAPAVDAVGLRHDLIKPDQFGRAGFWNHLDS